MFSCKYSDQHFVPANFYLAESWLVDFDLFNASLLLLKVSFFAVFLSCFRR